MIRWSSLVKWTIAAMVLGTVLWVAIAAWRLTLAVAAAIALWTAVIHIRTVRRQQRAVDGFRKAWRPRGKDILIVYSNSPHWQGYVESQWLPRWGDRAVVLNWSERQSWRGSVRPEVVLFETFRDSREFNPLAIVVPDVGRTVHVVRFWRAFRDFKHGKEPRLRAAEAMLRDHLPPTPYGHGGNSPV